MKPLDLSSANIASFVANNDLVIVDFWTPWCGPCRSFAPVFEQASQVHPEVAFGKVNTEIETQLAQAAKITSIPTLMAFKNGILVHSQPGALNPTGLEQLIEQLKALELSATTPSN